uniref:Uncharacterized protein n=1 Tax=Arundo donax TaxID=35708 RepID=A0A0A9ATK3_ARUDO
MVVTLQCRDGPNLLFDVVYTLHDMDYVVFHDTVDTTGDEARQVATLSCHLPIDFQIAVFTSSVWLYAAEL